MHRKINCHSGLHKERYLSPHTYLVNVGDLAATKKEQELRLQEELTHVWSQGPADLKSERRAVGNAREVDSPQRIKKVSRESR